MLIMFRPLAFSACRKVAGSLGGRGVAIPDHPSKKPCGSALPTWGKGGWARDGWDSFDNSEESYEWAGRGGGGGKGRTGARLGTPSTLFLHSPRDVGASATMWAVCSRARCPLCPAGRDEVTSRTCESENMRIAEFEGVRYRNEPIGGWGVRNLAHQVLLLCNAEG